MEIYNLVTRLRALKLELSDDILVHLILISLTAQFNPFKISYNTKKEKKELLINELIAQYVQEEEILKQENIKSAHLTSSSHDIVMKKRNFKAKGDTNKETSQSKVQQKQDLIITYFFCKKTDHMKKDCPKGRKIFPHDFALFISDISFELNLGSQTVYHPDG